MFLDPFSLPSQKVSLFTKIKRFWAKSRKQKSAGVVIYFNEDSRIRFLLIKRGGQYNDWIFSKGKVKSGESPEKTALREAKEETGLDIKIESELSSTYYEFYWDPDNIKTLKTVYWFLASSKSENTKFAENREGEAKDFERIKWTDLKTANRLIKHKSEKELLKEAGKILRIS